VAAWILVAAAGAAIGRQALPRTGLRGNYYTNLERSGAPIVVRIDETPSTDTLDNGSARVWPAFSVEWTGFIVVNRAGQHQFTTVSDDGSEIEIDGRIVVENGGRHGVQESRGAIPLERGIHPIAIRYEQDGGAFALAVNYAPPGESLTTIPASILFPDQVSYSGYLLREATPFITGLLAVLLSMIAAPLLRRRASLQRTSAPLAIDRPAVGIAIIVAVSVAVRILMMLGSNPILFADSEVFLSTVDSIKAGRFLEHDPFRTLLYPYFLLPFLRWSTEPPMDQVIVGAQHLLGVLTAVCVYVAGRRAMGPRVALAGALVLSLHTTQLFYEDSILSETFFTLIVVAALIPIGSYVEAPTARKAVVTGLACAAITLTRPVGQWFVVVPIAIGALMLPHWKDRIRIAVVTALVYGAVMLPWALVNLRQSHFFGIALGQGFGLFIREFDMDHEPPPEETAYPEVRDVLIRGLHTASPATFVRDELGDRRKYSVPQKDDLMNRFAKETIAKHPARFAVNTVKQWYQLIGHSLGDERICSSAQGSYLCTPRTQGYAREPFLNRPRHEHEPVRPLVVGYFRHFRIPIGVVFALAVFGLTVFLADRPPGFIHGVLLASTIVYFTFLPAVGQAPQDRYRLPIDGLLFLFAAYGVTRFVAYLRADPSRLSFRE